MARNRERRDLPQIYRRFEAIWRERLKKVSAGEHGMASGEGRGKEREKEFLNLDLFIQPHSAFGRSIGILRTPVCAPAGWLGRRHYIATSCRPSVRPGLRDLEAADGMSTRDARTDQRFCNPRVNPRWGKIAGDKSCTHTPIDIPWCFSPGSVGNGSGTVMPRSRINSLRSGQWAGPDMWPDANRIET